MRQPRRPRLEALRLEDRVTPASIYFDGANLIVYGPIYGDVSVVQ